MRYTVLTYIFNGYEFPHEIVEKDPDAEYLLITDDPNLKSETWTVIYDKGAGKSAFGKCYDVRFHPFRYANTDIVVRIDGSIQVMRSLKHYIDKFERGKYDRCVMIHPRRNTMPEEYRVWVAFRRYPPRQAKRCLDMMARMGYDMDYKGLYQGCFEIQRNNEVNAAVNDMTFGLLCLLGEDGKIERLDQTVTSFVMNRFFADRMKVWPMSENIITNSEDMVWHNHHSTIRVPNVEEKIEAFLFNKKTKVMG